MADLTKFIRVYQFTEGIERIRTAYRASINAMDEAYNRASLAMELHDGTNDEILDDDGNIIGSTEWTLRIKLHTAEYAIPVVCEAFITSIFHYWEVQAREWTGERDKGSDFKSLARKVSDKYPIHPHLAGLNALNNLLKHDNPKRFDDLAKLRGDHYFDRSVFFNLTRSSDEFGIPDVAISKNDQNRICDRKPSRRRGRGSLAINDFHVEEAFEIVAASGPTDEE